MPALPKDMVAIAIKTGASARAEVKTPPRFKAGDKVVARNIGSDSISMKFTDGNRAVLQKESAPCESIFGFLLSSPWV